MYISSSRRRFFQVAKFSVRECEIGGWVGGGVVLGEGRGWVELLERGGGVGVEEREGFL